VAIGSRGGMMFAGVIGQLLHYSGAIVKWSDWVCKWGGCCRAVMGSGWSCFGMVDVCVK